MNILLHAVGEVVIGVQGQVVTDVFETMQVLETQGGNERQFHVKHAVFIVRLQYEIAIRITDSLTAI